MSEELKQLLVMLQEMTQGVRKLIENQAQLASDIAAIKAEQARAGAALGESGKLLFAHAEVIRQIAQHTGFDLSEDNSPQPN